MLNEEDIKSQREFDDNICFGSFFIDIHHIDGAGMDNQDSVASRDVDVKKLQKAIRKRKGIISEEDI